MTVQGEKKRKNDARFWLLWGVTFGVVFVVASLVLKQIDDLDGVRAGIAGGLAGGSAIWVAMHDINRRARRAHATGPVAEGEGRE